MPGFAHPHDHHFPVAVEDLLAGRRKIIINVLIELGQAFTFNPQDILACLLKVKTRLLVLHGT
jgi:hypothetical protein